MPNEQYMAKRMAEKLVNDYNRNPYAFSDQDGTNIAFLAARYDLDFKPESKAVKKFAYGLANSASFGALSGLGIDAPMETGEEYGFGSTAGKVASGLGTIAGFAVPGAAGAKLAKAGLSGAAKIAPGLASKVTGSPRLASAVTGGATGGAALGMSNMLGDPSSIPENIAYGAVGGSIVGAMAPSLFFRPETLNKYGNEVPLLPQGSIGPRGQLGSSAGGSPIPMGPVQQQLSGSQRLPLPMGRAPMQNRLPSATSSGSPINLGGSLPHMTDDMDKIVNAVRNMKGQQTWGNKSAFNRMKSDIDNGKFYQGSPVDDIADIGRNPAVNPYTGQRPVNWDKFDNPGLYGLDN